MAFIANVNIAEEYAAIVEPNLYPDSTMVPGVTFNPHTLVGAGGRYVPKVTNGGIIDPTLPGQDYNFSGAADTLIQIVANNSMTPSKKIRNVQANAVKYPIVEANIETLVSGTIRPSFNAQAIAALINEGKDLGDTTAITASNVKQYLIELRKAMRDAGADGNVLIVTTDIYAAILEAAGADFDNEVKNTINMEAGVGRWMGWNIFESNVFKFTNSGKYYDYSGTLRTVDFTKVDCIAYDWKAFYIDTLLEMLKVQDGRTFNGVEIVSEFVNGYRVANQDKVLVKFNA